MTKARDRVRKRNKKLKSGNQLRYYFLLLKRSNNLIKYFVETFCILLTLTKRAKRWLPGTVLTESLSSKHFKVNNQYTFEKFCLSSQSVPL